MALHSLFSFHSNQFQAIVEVTKNLTGDKAFGTNYDWLLTWDSLEIPVLAVVVGDEIWFVGENDVVVRFDGWQVIAVENVLPVDVVVSKKLLSRFTCQNYNLKYYIALEPDSTFE